MVEEIFISAGKWLQFTADLVTTILGLAAIYGLVLKRKKLSQIMQVILNTHFNDRLRKLRETSSQLQRIPMNDESRYSEGISLLGQLSGQLKPLSHQNSEINRLHGELSLLLEGKRKVKDHKKNAVVHEIEAVLDELFVEKYVDLATKD